MLLCLLNSLAISLNYPLGNYGICSCLGDGRGGGAKRFMFLRCGLTASPYLTLKIKKAIDDYMQCKTEHCHCVIPTTFTSQQVGSSAYLCSAKVFLKIL